MAEQVVAPPHTSDQDAEVSAAEPERPLPPGEYELLEVAVDEHLPPPWRTWLARLPAHWPRYLAGAVVLLYVLTFVRGLAWEWRGIITATTATVPAVAAAPRGGTGAPTASQPAPGSAANAAGAAQPATSGTRAPLPATDEPPPRNATDKYGVSYDARGVAVMGIDADPSGVYNVPAGRQVRIGGPEGALFDVQPDGKLKPATAVRD